MERSAEMTDRLDDRIVLVTGGGGALGRHVVARFTDAGASVHVPVYDQDEADGLKDFLKERASSVQLHRDADLTRPEVVDRVFGTVEKADGRSPDILLNLAGGFHMAPVHETDPQAWDRMMRMNATTAFLCSRAAFPGMRERRWGRIVHVSALPALEGGQAGLSAYGAAKAAVLNLTRSLCREGAPHGITVNAVLPSIIDTPANREAMPDADTGAWIPPAEIAGVLHFLASDDARVLNGAALTLRLD
jgi:NAD(P)-dependent dehydrogenase (short-subunit alcohol dehydrogenase family)